MIWGAWPRVLGVTGIDRTRVTDNLVALGEAKGLGSHRVEPLQGPLDVTRGRA